MNCRACHDLIHQRLDATPAADDDGLEQHLRDCPRCRELHAAARRLGDGLRRLGAPVPPAGFAGRIVGSVLADRRARRSARRRVHVVLALAATLLLALGLRFFPSRSGHGPTPPAGPVATNRESVPPTPAPKPKLRDSVAEAGSAMADWTARTADAAVGETRRWLPPLPSPPLELPALDPSTGPLKEAGAGVTAGLEPVTDSWRRAADMLLRELPPMTPVDKVGS